MIIESGQEPSKREPDASDSVSEREPVQADKVAPDHG